MATNRRAFLKTSGIAGLAAATGLAGCSNLPVIGGGDGGSANSWLYDPAELVETGNKFYGSMNYAQLYENRQYLPQSGQSTFEATSESPVSPEQLDRIAGVGGATGVSSGSGWTAFGSVVVLGSFSASDLTGSIESQSEVSQSGEYQGFTLYESDMGPATATGMMTADGSATVALSDGTMVMGAAGTQGGSASVSGDDAARTMIDAGNGNATPLFGNNQYIDQLRNQFGSPTFAVGGQVDPSLVEDMSGGGGGGGAGGGMTGQFASGIRGGGFSMQLNGETTTFKVVGVYESADTAQQTGIVQFSNQMSDRMVQQSPAIDSFDASYNGAAVVITISGETQTLFQQGASQVPGGAFGGMGGGQSGTTPQPPQTPTPQSMATPTPMSAVAGSPEAPVVGFYGALSQGNVQMANQFVHPESQLEEVSEEDAPPDGVSIQVRSTEVRERSQNRATVAATIAIVQGENEQTNQVVFEVRPHNGQWKIYSSQPAG